MQENGYLEFRPQRHIIFLRGLIMFSVGSLIAIASLVAQDVYIMSVKMSWLPFATGLLVLVGLAEFLDTYITRNSSRFFVNLQFALLDTVVGFMLLMGLSYPPETLSLLIIVFLIVKGLFRLVGAAVGHFANKKSTMIGGVVSVILGLLIWMNWPSSPSPTFLSFCLSLEIALRGWALIHFAAWLKNAVNSSD